MSSLNGKVAIITGASSGIGKAAALLFAEEGARLVLTARNAGPLRDVAENVRATGASVHTLPGDVADEAHAKRLVQMAREQFGGLDIAFNNAGTLGPLMDTSSVSSKDWEETLRINLSSAFLAAKHQVPAMLERGSGSVIFTSTFVGYTAAMSGMASYAASKSGLIGLTQALAVEHGPNNVRVNALLPGGTDTPMGQVVASTPEAIAFVESLHALRRRAAPEEIARAALYLASDASSFVTGSAMLVDGGVSVARG